MVVDHDVARRRRRRDPSIQNGGPDPECSPDATTPVKRKSRKSKRKVSFEDEPSFVTVMLQVGTILFLISCLGYTCLLWAWPSTTNNEYDDDGEYVVEYNSEPEQVEANAAAATKDPRPQEIEKPTVPPLPVWELGNKARFDAYGIAEALGNNNNSPEEEAFWKKAAVLREDFSSRYGGENAARAMLQRGLWSPSSSTTVENSNDGYPNDLVHTACRIQEAKHDKRVFSMAFGGYSVTAGRGNFFSQSFPFVMERILAQPFKLLGIDLRVKNAAIGGIPSFPYGWCLKNFWGTQPDVVSWDYSMNEAGGVPEGLEAYLRHSAMLDRRPKIIVQDTHIATQRRELLQTYVDIGGFLGDPLVVHKDAAAEPFLARQEEHRPEGFQQWRRFGTPPGAPGQAHHHPAVKEHEMIGWVIAMHFLSALELVAADQHDSILNCPSLHTSSVSLPPPVAIEKANVSWSSLLFGAPSTTSTDKWNMFPIHCRTSFEPILEGGLESVLVSGTAGEGLDIMLPKGPMYYNKGWVLDLSDKEKLAKRKLNQFGGLGFVDSKKAYYGVYASGPLRLLLPYEAPFEAAALPNLGDDAQSWYRSLVVCEVNEKREPSECNTETDISYVVGGVKATETKMIDSAGILYLGKKLCMHVSVPAGAKITSRKALLEEAKKASNATVTFKDSEEKAVDEIGLSLVISIKNKHIHEKKNACSVSHVVWEQTALEASESKASY